MSIFRFFKMAAAAILDFRNLKLLTIGRLKRDELHRLAKFGRNRRNRWRDTTIFRFFKMTAVHHLGFVIIMCVQTIREGYLVFFITVQNLAGIDAVF